MKANYIEYLDLFNHLYIGVALTDFALFQNVEILRRYLVDNGAGKVCSKLGIGLRVWEKESLLIEKETIKREFIFIDGPSKGKALTLDEIKSIGLFLRGGPYYLETSV